MKYLTDPHENQIAYLGSDPEEGVLPAFFYFALSGEESLSLSPYNHPIIPLENLPLRCFSLTLPGHGHAFNKFKAMQYWADQMTRGNDLLEDFFEEALFSIQWLIEEHLVDPDRLAIGGLSRGGFVATHIAARLSCVQTLLGFAPLTLLSGIEEFSLTEVSRAKELDLERLIDQLTHIHHFRFYIGTLDTRVNTDACYHFIRQLAKKVHEKRARHCEIELILTPSIGHKGHGTAPSTFEEGAAWIKKHLLG